MVLSTPPPPLSLIYIPDNLQAETFFQHRYLCSVFLFWNAFSIIVFFSFLLSFPFFLLLLIVINRSEKSVLAVLTNQKKKHHPLFIMICLNDLLFFSFFCQICFVLINPELICSRIWINHHSLFLIFFIWFTFFGQFYCFTQTAPLTSPTPSTYAWKSPTLLRDRLRSFLESLWRNFCCSRSGSLSLEWLLSLYRSSLIYSVLSFKWTMWFIAVRKRASAMANEWKSLKKLDMNIW